MTPLLGYPTQRWSPPPCPPPPAASLSAPLFDEATVEELNVEITKINTLCEKVNADVVEVNIPPRDAKYHK
jgi:hypothetical protein